jgi:hypothetical protein
MASQLQLSESQWAETQKIFDLMPKKAVRLGKLLLDKEKEIETLFACQEGNC